MIWLVFWRRNTAGKMVGVDTKELNSGFGGVGVVIADRVSGSRYLSVMGTRETRRLADLISPQ